MTARYTFFQQRRPPLKNQIQLKESQIISKLDKSKALGQRALGSANWEVAEKFKRYLLGMRVAKSRTKETLRVGKSIAGSIPGVPIPKTLTKTAIDKDKALMYAALENFGFGVDWIIPRSRFKNL